MLPEEQNLRELSIFESRTAMVPTADLTACSIHFSRILVILRNDDMCLIIL